jgi:hypothetical protein
VNSKEDGDVVRQVPFVFLIQVRDRWAVQYVRSCGHKPVCGEQTHMVNRAFARDAGALGWRSRSATAKIQD